MTLEELVSTYGYAAIAVGTFLEGEMILVLGGFAAHRGYLDLSWVIACAFAGSVFGDQLYFHIGRAQGPGLLARRPGWQARAERVFRLLHAHQVWLILGFRFIYGLRTVTPFLLGAGRVSPVRFLVLNVIGGFAWAVAFGVLGYVFGEAMELVLGDLRRYELRAFLALAVAGALAWAVRVLWRRRAERPRPPPG